jgi:protein SSD1
MPAYPVPNLGQQLPLPLYANSLPQFAGYPNQLHVHPETENEDLSPLSFSPHADGSYQHQQLLAAQQLQYQQIQLLQAQLAASQMQQVQQHQQHHQSTSFIAPRFQALAAQRAAQQQQLQAQQLAQAQQVFEIQQQQLLEYQRRQEESAAANAAAIAEATLKNPPPVFEEDSPEPRHASLGSGGRPQLAPSFTFGAKRTQAEPTNATDRSSMSPPGQPVINRSEGIGGAAATGLAGLAARAHKRTGSELTPAMQQQVRDVCAVGDIADPSSKSRTKSKRFRRGSAS